MLSIEKHIRSDHDRLRAIMRYGERVDCRRQFFREYFGEVTGSLCGRCDNCLRPAISPVPSPPMPASAEPVQHQPAPAVGSTVRHGRFGKGKVVSIVGDDITVSFARYGERRVLLAYLSS